MNSQELPIDNLYGCEVGGTVTTGVIIYCIQCNCNPIAEWTSLIKFPRLQELIDIHTEHVESDHRISEFKDEDE